MSLLARDVDGEAVGVQGIPRKSLCFPAVFQYIKRISCIAGSYTEEYFV